MSHILPHPSGSEPHLSDQDIFEKSMSIMPPWADEALRGGGDRVLYVNGTELQFCKKTDWAGMTWLQERGIKTSTKKGP